MKSDKYLENSMIKFKTLEGISFQDISNVFNLSFSDYYLAITFSPEQLNEKHNSENGVLELSVGAFDDNKLVGFILHFYDEINGKKIIYNGGTGVIPTHRGQQLARKMFDFILPKLNNQNIDKLILEVLTINKPAIKVYKKLGFRATRTLDCFSGTLTDTTIKSSFQIKPMEHYDWPSLQELWDYEPTWQNSILAMNHLQTNNLSLAAYSEDTVIGYIIFNPKGKRIHQLAVNKNYRNQGVGTLLMNELANICKDKISFINIDQRIEGMSAFLNKLGMVKVTEQYEMETECNKIQST